MSGLAVSTYHYCLAPGHLIENWCTLYIIKLLIHFYIIIIYLHLTA